MKNSELPYFILKEKKIYAGEVIEKINGQLTLENFGFGYAIANRTAIINNLIFRNNYKSYLEIGVRDGKNFNKIKLNNKIGVDPQPLFESKQLVKLSSDEFFKENKKSFDIIFIDGLHLEEQVDKDIKNSLRCLNQDGFIIMHDCNPPTEFHQRENYEIDGLFPSWNGTVWKSFAKLRINNSNLDMCCIDCDWGVGIIKRGSQKLFESKDILNYNILMKNRKNLLNLLSVKEFLEK